MNAKRRKTGYEKCLDYAHDALECGDSRRMCDWLNAAIAYLDRRYTNSDAPAGCVLDYSYLHRAPVLRVYDVREGGYLDVHEVGKGAYDVQCYANAVAEANRLISVVVGDTPDGMLACWGEPDDETNTKPVCYVYASEVAR